MKKTSEAKARQPPPAAARPAKTSVPRPGGGAKAFIQQQQRKLAAAKTSADSGGSSMDGLPMAMIKAARASGQLNLSNRFIVGKTLFFCSLASCHRQSHRY